MGNKHIDIDRYHTKFKKKKLFVWYRYVPVLNSSIIVPRVPISLILSILISYGSQRSSMTWLRSDEVDIDKAESILCVASFKCGEAAPSPPQSKNDFRQKYHDDGVL